MKGLDKTYLYWYIKELLHFEKDIAVLSADMVIHLEVKGTPFYIFIKRITYAGNPYPQNTTRAQLPRREEFEDIKKSHAIFLFLGYDVENEVFACWDPTKTKNRLNERKYVSFFSRQNLQESARNGNIISASLQNDLNYVLFHINKLSYFLLHIKQYFPDIAIKSSVVTISDKPQGVLLAVEDDKSIKLLIDELRDNNENISLLAIIANCINEYGEFYNKMKLRDWTKIVDAYLKKSSNNFDKYEDSVLFRDDESVVAEP